MHSVCKLETNKTVILLQYIVVRSNLDLGNVESWPVIFMTGSPFQNQRKWLVDIATGFYVRYRYQLKVDWNLKILYEFFVINLELSRSKKRCSTHFKRYKKSNFPLSLCYKGIYQVLQRYENKEMPMYVYINLIHLWLNNHIKGAWSQLWLKIIFPILLLTLIQ